MSDIKISVVLTLYNKSAYISRTLRSILAQDFESFEVVIVDDCSTDNSLDKVLKFQDERIRIISHKVNKGQAAALNTGVSLSRGNLISFIDADDVWLTNYLSTVWSYYTESNKQSLIYANLLNVPPITLDGKNIYNHLLRSCSLASQSCISAPGDILQSVGGFSGIFEVDAEICIKLSKYYEVVCISEPLVISVVASDSLTANLLRVAEGNYELVKYFQSEIIDVCGIEIYAQHLFRIAKLYADGNDIKSAFQTIFKASKLLFIERQYVGAVLYQYFFIKILFKKCTLKLLKLVP